MIASGVYLHIPFCKSKCYYCAFNSRVERPSAYEEYVQCLLREIELRAPLLSGTSVNSVYFGGGTPTVLSAEQLVRLLTAVRAVTPVTAEAEITVEANPATFTEEYLNRLREGGFNRLSLGVQSLNEQALRAVGRVVTVEQTKQAISLAAKVFDNVSVDVMVGLPEQTAEDVSKIVDYVSCFSSVKHASVYTLMPEEGTALMALAEQGKLLLPSEDDTVDLYETAYALLEQKGFMRYEVSNFAKEGFEACHNNKYWLRNPYLGLGAGAHSLLGNVRSENQGNIAKYKRILHQGQSPVASSVTLPVSEQIEETIMLALRTARGLDTALLKEQYGYDILVEKQAELQKYAPYVIVSEGNIAIRKQYFEVMNTIIAALI